MLKLRDFQDQGYSVTRTSETSRSESDWAFWLCQKCVYEELDCKYNKRYYINVYVSEPRLWDVYRKEWPIKRSLTVKLCLERGELTYWISISKKGEFQSIEDIELVCQEVWTNLDMDYYE